MQTREQQRQEKILGILRSRPNGLTAEAITEALGLPVTRLTVRTTRIDLELLREAGKSDLHVRGGIESGAGFISGTVLYTAK